MDFICPENSTFFGQIEVLSQREFAGLMRVSIKTLQNWEQNRRHPTGPAAALLKIVVTAPDLALKTLHA
jgi:putative transcriptional regulator